MVICLPTWRQKTHFKCKHRHCQNYKHTLSLKCQTEIQVIIYHQYQERNWGGGPGEMGVCVFLHNVTLTTAVSEKKLHMEPC